MFIYLFQAMVDRIEFNDIQHNHNKIDWVNDSINVMMEKIVGNYDNCFLALAEYEKGF